MNIKISGLKSNNRWVDKIAFEKSENLQYTGISLLHTQKSAGPMLCEISRHSLCLDLSPQL